jgi:hypothetical protein
LYAYSIAVEVSQIVNSRVQPKYLLLATTWSAHSFGTIGGDNLRQLRDSVKDKVDRLINDYLAANPKQP